MAVYPADRRRELPDAPGVYLFRDQRGKVIYVGKAISIRKRVASHFSGGGRSTHLRAGRDLLADDRAGRGAGRPHRGRGAAGGAELHQAVQAAVQHPPARRQVLSVHRDLARRGLPPRLLHPGAPPPRPGLLRSLTATPSGCGRRWRCSARCSCSAPATAPSRAGAAARRAWTTTSSAARRPASATSTRRATARRSTG